VRNESTIGVLGVGAIAEAMVIGWCDGVEEPPTIVLSPRGRDRSASLAARFPTVEVAAHNQEVLDRAATVVVALRPQDVAATLGSLTFSPEHQLVSVAATVSVARLRELVGPADVLARAVPLPAVARRRGVTAVFPAHPDGRRLFEELGQVLAVDDEPSLDALSAATATIAAHLAYLAAISQWLTARGIPEEDASRYVVSTFAGVSEELERRPTGLLELADAHATPGGLNEQFLGTLRQAGFLDLVGRGLDEVAERASG